jgi:malate synthase
VWQWIRHGAILDNKKALTVQGFNAMLDEEMAKVRSCPALLR